MNHISAPDVRRRLGRRRSTEPKRQTSALDDENDEDAPVVNEALST
jgi:hypothetical protein